jgi:hypothetical protein
MPFRRSKKPLPLKQRTSSVDQRRDYSSQTWMSLLGLLKPREYLITVNNFSIWRRHLAWANENGKDLRDYMTHRYASSMVFMSLLLSAELGVLFNSASVTSQVREDLKAETFRSLGYWVGVTIILSSILTILSLISTFTAWTMVSSVSDVNAHCIFRSAIGQYVAELPGRFIVGSIYSFLAWLIMFFFLLLPVGLSSAFLLLFACGLFIHTIAVFSIFGRVLMHTSAMGSQRIFEPEFELTLLPHTLHSCLVTKARANLHNNTSIMRQYQGKQRPIDRHYSEEELIEYLSGSSCHRSLVDSDASLDASNGYDSNAPNPPFPPPRRRTGSLVKFADGYDTSGAKIAPEAASEKQPASAPLVDATAPRSSISQPQRPPRPLRSALHAPSFAGIAPKMDHDMVATMWLSSPSTSSSPSSSSNPDKLDSPSQSQPSSETSPLSNPHNGHPETLYATPSSNPKSIELQTPSAVSTLSSLNDTMNYNDLTDDERFDLEYGDMNAPSFSYSDDDPPSSEMPYYGTDEEAINNEWQNVYSDHHETVRLLPSTKSDSYNYSATSQTTVSKPDYRTP